MKTYRRHLLTATLSIMAVVLTISWVLMNGTATGWVRSPKNPMLTIGNMGDFDSQNIMSPAIAKDGDSYLMFYAGGPSGPLTKADFVRYQLGLALSGDGYKWTKRGKPLLPLGKRDNFHCTPALLRTLAGDLYKSGGLWHLVFCGNRADDVVTNIYNGLNDNGCLWVSSYPVIEAELGEKHPDHLLEAAEMRLDVLRFLNMKFSRCLIAKGYLFKKLPDLNEL